MEFNWCLLSAEVSHSCFRTHGGPLDIYENGVFVCGRVAVRSTVLHFFSNFSGRESNGFLLAFARERRGTGVDVFDLREVGRFIDRAFWVA